MHKKFNKYGSGKEQSLKVSSSAAKSCFKFKEDSNSVDVLMNVGNHRHRKIFVTNKTIPIPTTTKHIKKEPKKNQKQHDGGEEVKSRHHHKQHNNMEKVTTKTKSRHKLHKRSSVSLDSKENIGKKIDFLNEKTADVHYLSTRAQKERAHRSRHTHRHHSNKTDSVLALQQQLEVTDKKETTLHKKREERLIRKVKKSKDLFKQGGCGDNIDSKQLIVTLHKHKDIPIKPKTEPVAVFQSRSRILDECKSSVNIGPYEKYFVLEEQTEVFPHRKKTTVRRRQPKELLPHERAQPPQKEPKRKLKPDAVDAAKFVEVQEQDSKFDYGFQSYLSAIDKIIDKKLESMLKGDSNFARQENVSKETFPDKKRIKERALTLVNSVVESSMEQMKEKTSAETTEQMTADVEEGASCSRCHKNRGRRIHRKINRLLEDDMPHTVEDSTEPNSFIFVGDSMKYSRRSRHRSSDKVKDEDIRHLKKDENSFLVQGIEPAKPLHYAGKRSKKLTKKVMLECKTVAIVGINPKKPDDASLYCEEFIERKKKMPQFKLYYNYYGDKYKSMLASRRTNELENLYSDSSKLYVATSDSSELSQETYMNLEQVPIKERSGSQKKKALSMPDMSVEDVKDKEPVSKYLTKTLKRKQRVLTPIGSRLKNIIEEPSDISIISGHCHGSKKRDKHACSGIELYEKVGRDVSDLSLMFIKNPAFSDPSLSTLEEATEKNGRKRTEVDQKMVQTNSSIDRKSEEVVPNKKPNTKDAACGKQDRAALSQTSTAKSTSVKESATKHMNKVERLSQTSNSKASTRSANMNTSCTATKCNVKLQPKLRTTSGGYKKVSPLQQDNKSSSAGSNRNSVRIVETKLLHAKKTTGTIKTKPDIASDKELDDSHRLFKQKTSVGVNSSKSEVNLRVKSAQTSESQINSLITFDKYVNSSKRINSSKFTSRSNSLDRYGNQSIDQQTRTSSFLLTKDYRGGSQISAYEKRKSYDENIRKRMKRRMEDDRKRNANQFFEVRYLTVEKNNNVKSEIKKKSTVETYRRGRPRNVAVHYRKITNKTKDEAIACKIIETPMQKSPSSFLTERPYFFDRFSLSSSSDSTDYSSSLKLLYSNTDMMKTNMFPFAEMEQLQKIFQVPPTVNSSLSSENQTRPSILQAIPLDLDKAIDVETLNINEYCPLHHFSKFCECYKASQNVNQLMDYLCKSIVCRPPSQQNLPVEQLYGQAVSLGSRKDISTSSFANSYDSKESSPRALQHSEVDDEKVEGEDKESVVASPRSQVREKFSCPVLNSNASCFDFLYEDGSSDEAATKIDNRNMKNVNITKEQKQFIARATFTTTDCLQPESSRNSSEESGYSSVHSRKCHSLTNFFKRPNIVALFKNPSATERLRKDEGECEDVLFFRSAHSGTCRKSKIHLYEKMTKQCQSYAHKVRLQSELKKDNAIKEHCLEYREIPLGVLLGNQSSNVFDEDLDRIEARTENVDTTTAVGVNVSTSFCQGSESTVEHELKSCSLTTNEFEVVPTTTEDGGSKLADDEANLRLEFDDDLKFFTTTMCVKSASVSAVSEPCTVGDYKSIFNLSTIASTTSLIVEENPAFRKIDSDGLANDVGQSVDRKFFENLLQVYEKEIKVTTTLFEDEDFFRKDLLNAAKNSLDIKSQRRSKFRNFFRRKSKMNAGLETCPSKEYATSSEVQSESNYSGDGCGEMKYSNYRQLQIIAGNVKRHFSLLAQAVMCNQYMTDEIKICGFLKLLERIEHGDYTVLRREAEVNFENEIKEQIRLAFVNAYSVSLQEAKKQKRKLSPEDLELIRALTSKYRLGCLSYTNFIATYIGRGIIKTENQLKAAITYLIRLNTKDLNARQFEEFCTLKLT